MNTVCEGNLRRVETNNRKPQTANRKPMHIVLLNSRTCK
jgi:hypothetical protein